MPMHSTALSAPPPAAHRALTSTPCISALLNRPTASVTKKLLTAMHRPASSVVVRSMLLENSTAIIGPQATVMSITA